MDNTLILGDAAFAKAKEEELNKAHFLAKAREQLTLEIPLKFNGKLIQLVNNAITLTQKCQCINLATINVKSLLLKNKYIAQQARGVYIALVC